MGEIFSGISIGRVWWEFSVGNVLCRNGCLCLCEEGKKKMKEKKEKKTERGNRKRGEGKGSVNQISQTNNRDAVFRVSL